MGEDLFLSCMPINKVIHTSRRRSQRLALPSGSRPDPKLSSTLGLAHLPRFSLEHLRRCLYIQQVPRMNQSQLPRRSCCVLFKFSPPSPCAGVPRIGKIRPIIVKVLLAWNRGYSALCTAQYREPVLLLMRCVGKAQLGDGGVVYRWGCRGVVQRILW